MAVKSAEGANYAQSSSIKEEIIARADVANKSKKIREAGLRWLVHVERKS